MCKLYPIVLGLVLIFNLSFTDNITKMSNEIPGIGTVHQYQTGKNTYVGINFNLEMLFIATATGSGFTHLGYSPHNEVIIFCELFQDSEIDKHYTCLQRQN